MHLTSLMQACNDEARSELISNVLGGICYFVRMANSSQMMNLRTELEDTVNNRPGTGTIFVLNI